MQDFKRIQYEFAAYIRNPLKNSKPKNIEDRRLAIYSELFYNNVEDFIASGFPVLRTLYTDEDWHAMIRDYFSRHKAKTPHFQEMAKEFVAFLQDEFQTRDCDPPFMLELAHYEWMETAVYVSTDVIEDDGVNLKGDLLDEPVVISPLAWLLTYQWPVHEISVDHRPDVQCADPTLIIIYRDRAGEVGFMQVNPVTARLFELLDNDNKDITGRQALEQIATELQHPQPEVIVNGGLDTLRLLRKKDIVLGTYG